MKDCTTCKYGHEDERLGIPMCHHPKRFSEDCIDFNMHEEEEIKESGKPFKEPIDGVLYAAACGIKNKGQIEKSEKPVPKDLEEAAENYAALLPQGRVSKKYSAIDFIAGAKWQAEQDQETIELAEDHAYLAGAVNEREKLMKEAVEGEVVGEVVKDINNKLAVTAKGINLDGFKFGDKVRIIIVKEKGKCIE